MQLKLLSTADCQAVLEFEIENKQFFEQHAPPRPAEFFNFNGLYEIIELREKEQDVGECYLYLVYDDDKIIGRLSLFNIEGNVAELGYRFAENKTKQGIATKMVMQLIQLAKLKHGLTVLTAYTTTINMPSIRILEKNNFKHMKIEKQAAQLNGETLDFTHYKLKL